MFFRLFSVATKKAEVLKYSYGSLIKKIGGGGRQAKEKGNNPLGMAMPTLQGDGTMTALLQWMYSAHFCTKFR